MSPVEEALLAEARKLTDLPIVRVRAFEDEDHTGSPVYRVLFGVRDDLAIREVDFSALNTAIATLRDYVQSSIPIGDAMPSVVFSYERSLR
jgi:hypothetical protein